MLRLIIQRICNDTFYYTIGTRSYIILFIFMFLYDYYYHSELIIIIFCCFLFLWNNQRRMNGLRSIWAILLHSFIYNTVININREWETHRWDKHLLVISSHTQYIVRFSFYSVMTSSEYSRIRVCIGTALECVKGNRSSMCRGIAYFYIDISIINCTSRWEFCANITKIYKNRVAARLTGGEY